MFKVWILLFVSFMTSASSVPLLFEAMGQTSSSYDPNWKLFPLGKKASPMFHCLFIILNLLCAVTPVVCRFHCIHKNLHSDDGKLRGHRKVTELWCQKLSFEIMMEYNLGLDFCSLPLKKKLYDMKCGGLFGPTMWVYCTRLGAAFELRLINMSSVTKWTFLATKVKGKACCYIKTNEVQAMAYTQAPALLSKRFGLSSFLSKRFLEWFYKGE